MQFPEKWDRHQSWRLILQHKWIVEVILQHGEVVKSPQRWERHCIPISVPWQLVDEASSRAADFLVRKFHSSILLLVISWNMQLGLEDITKRRKSDAYDNPWKSPIHWVVNFPTIINRWESLSLPQPLFKYCLELLDPYCSEFNMTSFPTPKPHRKGVRRTPQKDSSPGHWPLAGELLLLHRSLASLMNIFPRGEWKCEDTVKSQSWKKQLKTISCIIMYHVIFSDISSTWAHHPWISLGHQPTPNAAEVPSFPTKWTAPGWNSPPPAVLRSSSPAAVARLWPPGPGQRGQDSDSVKAINYTRSTNTESMIWYCWIYTYLYIYNDIYIFIHTYIYNRYYSTYL